MDIYILCLFCFELLPLAALAFKRSASKDSIPFFTACLQAILSSASSCQVSVLIPVSFKVCLCSAFFAHHYLWRLWTTLNRKFASTFDRHSFVARGRPISTVPSLASPRYHPLWHVANLQDLIVRDLVLPFDTNKVSEMPHVEGIQHLHMSTIAGPGLSSIQ